VPALRGLKVPLFSDLLLHDMGPGLADGIEQESASGSEFRTPPLWGLRFSAPYLHDGRAGTPEEARLEGRPEIVFSKIDQTVLGAHYSDFNVRSRHFRCLETFLVEVDEAEQITALVAVDGLTSAKRILNVNLVVAMPSGQPVADRLRALLDAWPVGVPVTFEFQDPSWVEDDVFELLRSAAAAVCATDLEANREPPRIDLTGRFLYLRLRREAYATSDLEAWAARIVPFLEAGHDVFTFFRHDAEGLSALRALELMSLVEGVAG